MAVNAGETYLSICYKDTKNPQKCYQLNTEKCCKNKNSKFTTEYSKQQHNKKLTGIKITKYFLPNNKESVPIKPLTKCDIEQVLL